MTSWAMRRLAHGYLRAGELMRTVRTAAHGAATGWFASVLTQEEQASLSIAVYEAAAGRRPARTLNEWEVAWLARRLPAAPSRVLVAAAGEGPEVRHLLARGHRVDAFEPAAAAAARCRELDGVGDVLVARYEDLAAAVLDGKESAAAPLAGRRYDAVLLGWGSLSHVLDAHERRRVIEACARLAPDGPILASFLVATEEARAGLAGNRLGRLAGAPLGRLRGAGPADGSTAFGAWFGFLHLFQPGELDGLAHAVGRHALRDDDGTPYPHVTLR